MPIEPYIRRQEVSETDTELLDFLDRFIDPDRLGVKTTKVTITGQIFGRRFNRLGFRISGGTAHPKLRKAIVSLMRKVEG